MKLRNWIFILAALPVAAGAQNSNESKTKEGYHDLALPNFKGLDDAKGTPSKVRIEGTCQTSDGRTFTPKDPGYQSCTSALAAQKPGDATTPGGKVNWDMGSGH